jgi:hypothetical protein
MGSWRSYGISVCSAIPNSWQSYWSSIHCCIPPSGHLQYNAIQTKGRSGPEQALKSSVMSNVNPTKRFRLSAGQLTDRGAGCTIAKNEVQRALISSRRQLCRKYESKWTEFAHIRVFWFAIPPTSTSYLPPPIIITLSHYHCIPAEHLACYAEPVCIMIQLLQGTTYLALTMGIYSRGYQLLGNWGTAREGVTSSLHARSERIGGTKVTT